MWCYLRQDFSKTSLVYIHRSFLLKKWMYLFSLTWGGNASWSPSRGCRSTGCGWPPRRRWQRAFCSRHPPPSPCRLKILGVFLILELFAFFDTKDHLVWKYYTSKCQNPRSYKHKLSLAYCCDDSWGRRQTQLMHKIMSFSFFTYSSPKYENLMLFLMKTVWFSEPIIRGLK